MVQIMHVSFHEAFEDHHHQSLLPHVSPDALLIRLFMKLCFINLQLELQLVMSLLVLRTHVCWSLDNSTQ